jgi:uncharacterized protein YodC (DUF2158 family)
MPACKEGDVVQLHSGGSKMTIIALDTSSGEATCRWCAGRTLTEDICDVAALACLAQAKPAGDRCHLGPGNAGRGL